MRHLVGMASRIGYRHHGARAVPEQGETVQAHMVHDRLHVEGQFAGGHLDPVDRLDQHLLRPLWVFDLQGNDADPSVRRQMATQCLDGVTLVELDPDGGLLHAEARSEDLRAAEYVETEPNVVWGLHWMTSPYDETAFTLDFERWNASEFGGEVTMDLDRMVRFKASADYMVHRLDHDPISNLQAVSDIKVDALIALAIIPQMAVAAESLDMTSHPVGLFAIAIFLIAYLLVMAEEFTHLRKSKKDGTYTP